MKSASPFSYSLLRTHARHRGGRDLTIIPMLDVMVILAFFLIFTAVFSRTSILELNLPGPDAPAAAKEPSLELEVIVRRTSLEVADRNSGVLQTIPATTAGPDVVRLSQYLEEVKARFPDKRHATLLVANDVDYDTIVQVMDAVSVRQYMDGRRLVRNELFPQIALGDAPQVSLGDAPT
jgi:biopolymer transport protein ExbD